MDLSTPSIAKASLQGIELLRPYGTFSHPNSMAGYFLLIYLLFLINPFQFKNFLLRQITLLACIFIIFVSFSKIAALSLILLTLFWVFNRNQKDCIVCRAGLLLIILSFSSIVLSATTDVYSAVKRILLLKHSLSIFVANPFFGTSFGHYLFHQQNYPNPYSFFSMQPVHNIFIFFLTETGLFLGGVIYYLIAKYIWNNKKNIFLIYIFFAVAITGFFDHYWLNLQQNMLLMAVFAGLAISAVPSRLQ